MPADPMAFPKKKPTPKPGDPMPVWHCTWTADELRQIADLRGPQVGMSRMEAFVKEAVLEKARREVGGGYSGRDLESLTPKELTSLAMNVIGTQMERAAKTVSEPGFRWDVKGELLRDPDGQPVHDVDQVTKAQAELRQWLKSLREMKGLDAPSKKRVKHTVVHQEIVKLATQMGIDPGDDDVLALPAGEDDEVA